MEEGEGTHARDPSAGTLCLPCLSGLGQVPPVFPEPPAIPSTTAQITVTAFACLTLYLIYVLVSSSCDNAGKQTHPLTSQCLI